MSKAFPCECFRDVNRKKFKVSEMQNRREQYIMNIGKLKGCEEIIK
jgi:hypothetical protein